MKSALLLVVLFTLWTATSDARVLRSEYESIRTLGMGNAFLGLVDDENALWYNPAGLARNKKFAFHVADLELGVDSVDTMNRFADAIFGGDFDDAVRTDIQYARMRVAPTFVFPNAAFSLYAREQAYLKIENLTGSEVDITSVGDLGAIVGAGLPVGPDLSFGASVRAFLRSSIDLTKTPAQLLADLGLVDPNDFLSAVYTQLENEQRYGFAIGLNAGALLRVPIKDKNVDWKIAATVENVAGTSFTSLDGFDAPDSLPMTFNLGTAFNYKLSKDSTFNILADWRDFLGDDFLFKHLHFGMEMNLKAFSIRAGYYQGSYTYGLSFRALPHTRIHFASYQWIDGDAPDAPGRRWYTVQAIIGFNPI